MWQRDEHRRAFFSPQYSVFPTSLFLCVKEAVSFALFNFCLCGLLFYSRDPEHSLSRLCVKSRQFFVLLFWVFRSDFSLCIMKRRRPYIPLSPKKRGQRGVRGKLLCAVEEMLVLFMLSIVSGASHKHEDERKEKHGKRKSAGFCERRRVCVPSKRTIL